MRDRTRPLPIFEIAVRGRGAPLAPSDNVGPKRHTKGACRLMPFETCAAENLVETFSFGLPLHTRRARDHQRAHRSGDLAPIDDPRGRPKVRQSGVGAGADESNINRCSDDWLAWLNFGVGVGALPAR